MRVVLRILDDPGGHWNSRSSIHSSMMKVDIEVQNLKVSYERRWAGLVVRAGESLLGKAVAKILVGP